MESVRFRPSSEHQIRLITFYLVDLVGMSSLLLVVLSLAELLQESGDTMRAAGLHAIDTLIQSEAVLIKSSAPKNPTLVPLINLIASRIAGVVAANKFVICSYNVCRDKLSAALAITPGRRAPTISPLEEEHWVAVSSMVEKNQTADIMDKLMKVGAEDILVFNLDNCRV
jgi:ATP phosphoribosyltransferase